MIAWAITLIGSIFCVERDYQTRKRFNQRVKLLLVFYRKRLKIPMRNKHIKRSGLAAQQEGRRLPAAPFSTVHCKGERRKTWWKTTPPSLWSNKSIQKAQIWKFSRLCPETSTKLYVNEFGFRCNIFGVSNHHREESYWGEFLVIYRSYVHPD